jgi:ribosome-binding factor A
MHRRRQPAGAPAYARTARVNALLQEVLAEEIERLADVDERLRMLTVTGVVADPDLRHARVYLASLPADGAEALGEQRRRLQAVIGREVRMRCTPTLEFVADPAVEAGERVEQLLRERRRQD